MKAWIGKRVLITEDCRDGHPATGKHGIYEGDFPRTVLVKYGGEVKETMYDWWMSENGKPWRDALTHVSEILKPGVEDSLDNHDNWWSEWNNPRIKLDDGSYIWGDECWWGLADEAPPTLEEAQADLEKHKEVLRAVCEAAEKEQE